MISSTGVVLGTRLSGLGEVSAVSRTQTSVALKTVVWVRDYEKVVPVKETGGRQFTSGSRKRQRF